VVINKHAAGDTASIIFQNGYSGRAEIGLSGTDQLSVKVSADGINFVEALNFDALTGKPSFPRSSILEDYAINLLQDSGRMAGNGVNAVNIGSFAFPGYLTAYNGAVAVGLGKFIFDNADFGGAGAALNAHVRALVEMIRDASHRRYGVEFWVCQMTMGAGTVQPQTIGADTGYLALFSSNVIRPPKLTFHVYLKALDANLLVPLGSGRTATKNGVFQASSFAVTPADGWVSVTIHDAVAASASFGYQPSVFEVYAKAAGQRFLFACPAQIGGLTNLDDNIGIVASANSWPA
jgi:hypothetical protein